MNSARRLLVVAIAAGCGLAAAAQPASEKPAAAAVKTQHAVGYYDDTRQRVVIVGSPANPREGDRDRVWSWDGARWEVETEAGPPGRVNAAAAYDRRHGQAVVAGGSRQAAVGDRWDVVGDTWIGDGKGWRRVADITPRDHQSMVYDEGREAVLMFGGISGDRSTPWPSDTWELRRGRWSRIATEGPAGRGRTAMAYDGARRQLVLFGGVGGSPAPDQPQPWYGDTWVWEWSALAAVADDGPRARYAHGMVFDERAGVVLLYSGAAAHRDAPLSDMWKWDGRALDRDHPLRADARAPLPAGHGVRPGPRQDCAVRRRSVESDTWEWDGVRWRQVAS